MPRQSFVQCPRTGRLVPAAEVDWPRDRTRRTGYQIMPDIEEFVSPVDGSVVSSRSSLRAHNERNDVVQFHEFDGEWEAKAKERAAAPTSKAAREERVQDIIQAIDQVERGEGHAPREREHGIDN